MNKRIIIIGGGVGGLFTGALLAKNNCEVVVLEKNAIAGGGLQCFRRHGDLFETGMHILGGFQEGGCLNRICSYLGVMDKLSIRPSDDDAIDSITYLAEGRKEYRIPHGKEAFTRYFTSEFPQESEGIQAYVEALYRMADEIDLFNLRRPSMGYVDHGPKFLMAADELIASYVKDERLRDVLAYMNPMYGGVKGHTPAYIHAMINVLYIEGSCQFNDGGQQLADALGEVIRQHGGSVVTGDGVEHIQVEDRMVKCVVTRKGRTYRGDMYISDIHPVSLLQLTGEDAFPPSFRNRLYEIPNSCSAFIVFLKFKEGQVPFVNHPRYYQEHYGQVWHHAEHCDAADWPQGFMYITPPSREQGPFASRMTVNCLMSFDEVRCWEDTTVGHRGAEYEEWKARNVQRVMAKLEQLHPGISESVEYSFAASPLTIRDYYGVKDGSLYGYQHDCQNMMLSQIHIATKVRNLLLTGQNIYLHGICGVPLTSIVTAEALLGAGTILDKV